VKRKRDSGLRRALRRLTDPHLISWPFFFLSLAAWLVSFYPQVFRAQEPFTTELIAGWVLSILAGQVVLFAFLFIARTLWLRTAWASRHPAVTVWTFIVGTLLGVITANSIAQQLPAGDQGLMFGVEHLVFGVLGLCIVGSIYIAFRSYRIDVTELEAKRHELQALLVAGEKTLEIDRATVQATVTEAMTEAVGVLRSQDPGVIDFLNASSDKLLRPLSHELAANTAGIDTVAVEVPRPRWRNVIAEVTAKPLIAPFLTALILLLFAWRISFNEVLTAPPQAELDAAGNTIGVSIDLASFTRSILELLSVFVGTYVTAWLVLKATITPLRKSSPRVRLIITAISAVVIAALSQVIIGVLFTALNLQTMIDRNLLARALILIPIAGVTLLMGIVRATDLAQRDVKDQLRETNRTLTWQVARINEEIWDERRTLALVVHGPIRAALISSAMELSKANDPSDPQLIQTLTDRISQARTDFLDPPAQHDPLDALTQLQQLWAGTCAISVDMDEHTRERITADRITAQVATKVIEEACANAVIHGSATTVAVDIQAREDELDLSVTNNGASLEPGKSAGLGTTLINEVSLHWSLVSENGRISLRAALPLSTGESAAITR
jgi:hypothetical protein